MQEVDAVALLEEAVEAVAVEAQRQLPWQPRPPQRLLLLEVVEVVAVEAVEAVVAQRLLRQRAGQHRQRRPAASKLPRNSRTM
jgi:hypothetical protein